MTGRIYCSQRGVSLVEILVALAVSMVILGGVMQALVTNQRNAAFADDVAYIQENGRYALEIIARDARWAGYWGCALSGEEGVTFANSLDVPGDHDWLSLQGVRGFDSANGGNPNIIGIGTLWEDAANYLGSTTYEPDSVIFRGADDDLDLTVVTHTPASANFKLSRNNPLTPGDLALVVSEDCTDVGLMQMTGPSSGANEVLVHNKGDSETPGNCTKVIRWDNGSFNCDDPPGNSEKGQAYGPGSFLMRFQAIGYYIGTSVADPSQPALYRVQYSSMEGSDVVVRSDEIAMGVEDMQILYGVDSSGDSLANVYLSANDVGNNAADWDRIVSVRFMLLLRGYGENRSENSAVSYMGYPFAGADESYQGHEYQDLILRQQVSKTIRLRNVAAI
jgi:type IV pilus assembly protein PilW